MSNYNYAIEKHLAERGGEADKNITRTCGNCELYNERLLTCERVDNGYDTSIYKADDDGCYYHRTNKENERLKVLVKQRQDETNRLRLEEQRKNGTGDCAGCPFREMHEEMYAMFKKCLTDLACSTFYNRYEEIKELMRKLNNKVEQ
jgi:hypothetical protein